LRNRGSNSVQAARNLALSGFASMVWERVLILPNGNSRTKRLIRGSFVGMPRAGLAIDPGIPVPQSQDLNTTLALRPSHHVSAIAHIATFDTTLRFVTRTLKLYARAESGELIDKLPVSTSIVTPARAPERA